LQVVTTSLLVALHLIRWQWVCAAVDLLTSDLASQLAGTTFADCTEGTAWLTDLQTLTSRQGRTFRLPLDCNG